MALWYPQKFTHDEPPSSPTVTPGGRNTKYSEFAVGCGTAGSEAISSWTKRWISASSTLGGGAVVRAMAPLREPCVIAKSSVLYSRSEEHTSELQSQSNLVCRLLLEKKTS